MTYDDDGGGGGGGAAALAAAAVRSGSCWIQSGSSLVCRRAVAAAVGSALLLGSRLLRCILSLARDCRALRSGCNGVVVVVVVVVAAAAG